MRLGWRIAAFALAVALAAGGARAEAPRPNIVFILADDLGYGDLGCYGQKRIWTPNIDRLAAEGIRFTDCYAGGTVCAPSRCALMTGMHTGHARIRGNKDVPLLEGDVTVAETLKGAGYATALIGKWGLGNPDTTGLPGRQGFDYSFGFLDQTHAHNYYPDHLFRNGERVELRENARGSVGGFEHDLITPDALQYAERRTGKKGSYAHDLFTREALEYVAGRKGKEAEPFFLYLAYTIPHANNELGAATKNGMEVPSDAPYWKEDWPQPERNFAAMVTRMDADVGRLMEAIKSAGLDERTIVFFSSDNGPHHEGGHKDTFFQSAGAVRGSKRDLYDGGIRVPMIARWPGKIAAGRTSSFAWAFWDLLPTAAELAGAKAPAGIDGRSVAGPLLGAEAKRGGASQEFFYWEFHEGGFSQAARMGMWKGVRRRSGAPLEIYDLESDLREERNLAAERPEIVQKFEAYLKTARTESADWPVKK